MKGANRPREAAPADAPPHLGAHHQRHARNMAGEPRLAGWRHKSETRGWTSPTTRPSPRSSAISGKGGQPVILATSGQDPVSCPGTRPRPCMATACYQGAGRCPGRLSAWSSLRPGRGGVRRIARQDHVLRGADPHSARRAHPGRHRQDRVLSGMARDRKDMHARQDMVEALSRG